MPTVDCINIIRQSLIFSGLEEDEAAELARLCTEKRLAIGEYAFWEGDEPDRFYLLTSGKIKVVKHSSTGKDFIIAFFEPGEIFGEVAVFENRPYPASAQAVEDSIALGIKREDFLKFLSKRPEVALRLINVLGDRLRTASDRLRDLAGERVEQRLARILLMLSSKLGPSLPFTRQDIADMAGTTIETAIRFLSSLNSRKITRSARGRIVILDELKLKLLSEGPPPL
jgi:CRP/FNR family transcriptional regulator